MKKLGTLLLTMLLLVGLSACGGDEDVDTTADTGDDTALTGNANLDVTATGTMVIEGFGEISFELYGNNAPITVENFITLAEEGFYDGLIFHRVIPTFMIQGGDPNGNGTGGSDATITGEFSTNGIENILSHTSGVLSMARASDPDSASSQFFIMHEDATYLDGQYAAFGMVTSGMDVVDAIANVETDASDKPVDDVVITSITIDGSEEDMSETEA